MDAFQYSQKVKEKIIIRGNSFKINLVKYLIRSKFQNDQAYLFKIINNFHIKIG